MTMAKLTGAFADLTKFGGMGWGISIECDGDVFPGAEVEVRRKDGQMKKVKVDDILYEDPWKVVCTIEEDPNDRPAGSRKGKTTRAADLGSTREDEEDPRPRRQGTVTFGSKTLDLGEIRVRAGVFDYEDIVEALDL